MINVWLTVLIAFIVWLIGLFLGYLACYVGMMLILRKDFYTLKGGRVAKMARGPETWEIIVADPHHPESIKWREN